MVKTLAKIRELYFDVCDGEFVVDKNNYSCLNSSKSGLDDSLSNIIISDTATLTVLIKHKT